MPLYEAPMPRAPMKPILSLAAVAASLVRRSHASLAPVTFSPQGRRFLVVMFQFLDTVPKPSR